MICIIKSNHPTRSGLDRRKIRLFRGIEGSRPSYASFKKFAKQVAAITEHSGDGEQKTVSVIIAYAHNSQSRTIHDYNGCYDQSQYPLIFPSGDIGWHHLVNDMAKEVKDEEVIDLTKDEDDVQFFTPSMKQPIEQISTYTETKLADLGTPSNCNIMSFGHVKKTTTVVQIQHVDGDVPLQSKVDASSCGESPVKKVKAKTSQNYFRFSSIWLIIYDRQSTVPIFCVETLIL